MEKKAQLYEIIIKFVFAVVSFISAVFVVKNLFFMLPLFNAFSCNERQLFELIYNTQFGGILSHIGVITTFSFNTIVKGFIGFIANIEWIGILFLLLTIALLLLRFIFINWTLVKQYLHLALISILLYILKLALFGLAFAICYKDSTRTIALGFVAGIVVYLITCCAQIFVFSLMIIKFIFNISGDIKYYLSH